MPTEGGIKLVSSAGKDTEKIGFSNAFGGRKFICKGPAGDTTVTSSQHDYKILGHQPVSDSRMKFSCTRFKNVK